MSNTDEIRLKGQAWIFDNKSLVQSVTIIKADHSVTETTEILIDDIWENLVNGTDSVNDDFDATFPIHQSLDGKYLYWIYKMSDSEIPENDVITRFECPKPKVGLFKEPYNEEDGTNAYSKYWLKQLRIAAENYENSMVIQKKEIIFPETCYQKYTLGGDKNPEMTKIDEIREQNNDIGDISNLLSLF